MRPLSDSQFIWLGVISVLIIVVGWGARDALLLRRYAREKNATPDQVFGSVMGLVMVALGAIGLVLHFLER